MLPARQNPLLLQCFEWHTPGNHYQLLTSLLPKFARLGVTSLWLPPGCKALNADGNGYDVYDIWDLGEFTKDGSAKRGTKWGTRQQLDELLRTAREEGMSVIWDAVLNHKAGAEATEQVWAVEVDARDRRYEIAPPKKIEAWLRFEFPGREAKYSNMRWRAEHFNGVDWDHTTHSKSIFKLIDDPASHSSFTPPTRRRALSSLFRRKSSQPQSSGTGDMVPQRPGKGWMQDVDCEHGNNDFLMFANIDYTHPAVRADAIAWGEWMLEDVGVDGFRLDAVQHYSSNFTRDWIRHVQQRDDKDVFVVGEVWTGEVERIINWLDAVQPPESQQHVYAFDSPLLYNFSNISQSLRPDSQYQDPTKPTVQNSFAVPQHPSFRGLIKNSLLAIRPQQAVTVVTNHDTQPGQTSFTPMAASLKKIFYAFTLLRKEGLPCVFWGDLFGTYGPHAETPACAEKGRNLLVELMVLRKLCAHGMQTNYFSDSDDVGTCVGWTRAGFMNEGVPGCAVVLNIGTQVARKNMSIGSPGETWVNVLAADRKSLVKIGADSHGSFACGSTSVAVFVKEEAWLDETFPIDFDRNIFGRYA